MRKTLVASHYLSISQAQGIQIVGEDFLVTGKKATVFTAANTGKKAAGVKWQYEESPGKWNDYEDGAMDIVEGAYEVISIGWPSFVLTSVCQDWQKDKRVDVRAVKSGHWIYQVDFNKMTQVRCRPRSSLTFLRR